jgi:hypothetical protein
MTRQVWLAVLLCGALPAEASEAQDPGCDFRLSCRLGKHEFSMFFDSASGECPEDDMRVFVETPKGKTELALAPAWYRHISNVTRAESICQLGDSPDRLSSGVTAFAVDAQRALVFFTRDGRPFYHHVGVALLDVATGKVLDVQQSLGQSKEDLVAVFKTPRGYKLRLIREHLQVQCDCTAAVADDWMGVEVVNGKLRARWLRC